MVEFELYTKNYAQMVKFEHETNIVPRRGEIVNIYGMSKTLNIDKDFEFMVYDVSYAFDNEQFVVTVKCRQWFEGNKIEEIFEGLWWVKN